MQEMRTVQKSGADIRHRCWAVLAAVISIVCAASAGVAAADPPNILLIVADDLGFSDLGCYGSEIATPHLDSLAARGVRLTQFYTTGRCCPSRASILTGLYPHRVGLGHMTKDLRQPGYRGRVADGTQTIAQLLRQQGYRAFLSGKWHLGTQDPTLHGFEEFFGTLVSAKTFWEADHFLRLPEGRPVRHYGAGEFYGTDALADYAMEFLRQSRETPDRPWFLYLAFNAPHFPLHARPDDIARYADRYDAGWDVLRRERLNRMKQLGIIPQSTELSPRSPYYDWGTDVGVRNPEWDLLSDERKRDLARRMAIYAAMVDRLDQSIGRVIAELEYRNELRNTLVVFTSDNGACAEWDPFGFDIRSGPQNILHRGQEISHMGSAGTFHSVGSGWAGASNTPWRLYKHFNHEGGIAVPCIIHWPGRLRDDGGRIVDTPAHLIDLVPTMLDAAGSRAGSNVVDELPGSSLLPLLDGEALPARMLFFEHEGNRAVRAGRWKLVALRRQDWELYDMSVDRSEMRNRASERPELVRQLSDAWDGWAKRNHVTPLPDDYGVEYITSGPSGQSCSSE